VSFDHLQTVSRAALFSSPLELVKSRLHLASTVFFENVVKLTDDVFATTELDLIAALTGAKMIGVDIHLLNSTTEINM